MYVEGANADGSANDDKANRFNDRRIVLAVILTPAGRIVMSKWRYSAHFSANLGIPDFATTVR